MKRLISLLLIIATLLCGCAAGTQPEKKAEVPQTAPATEPDRIVPGGETEAVTENTPVAENTEIPPVIENEEVAIEEEAVSETPQENTESPKVDDAPVQNTTQQPAPEPVPEPEPQPTPQPSTNTSASARPTSSATCKDTGSNAIWENPDGRDPEPYEVESDPSRTKYLEWLKVNGNPYFFYFIEDGMRMYVGRVYGMPIITGYETMFECTWTCSDPTIATVNALGYVTPLKAGNATITVTHTDPETQVSTIRECSILVEDEPIYTYAYLEQKAHEEAQEIARLVMSYEYAETDLERIGLAAGMVHQYVINSRGGANKYVFENGMPVSNPVSGYNQPFGTLVTRRSSCAGDVRALGLVLEYMGYEWYHVNEDQWDHQWLVVYNVDGQTAFADPSQLGAVGYGQRQEDRSNWQVYQYRGLHPVQ